MKESNKLVMCDRCKKHYIETDGIIITIGLMGKPIRLCPYCAKEFQDFLNHKHILHLQQNGDNTDVTLTYYLPQ